MIKILLFSLVISSVLLGDIKIGYVPGGTNDLSMTKYKGEALSEYFNKKISEKVIVVRYSDYSSLKSALFSKNVDIAIVANYQYRKFIKVGIPIVNISKVGKKLSSYMIVVNKSSGINDIKDLEGKVLASDGKTGSISFLSSVVKKNPEDIFFKIIKDSSSNRLIGKVASNKADVVCVNEGIYNSILRYKPHYRKNLKVLYTSKKYAPDLIIASKKLTSVKLNKIRLTFLKMRNDSEGEQVLIALKIARFISPVLGEGNYPYLNLYKRQGNDVEEKRVEKVAVNKRTTKSKTKIKTKKVNRNTNNKIKKDEHINIVEDETEKINEEEIKAANLKAKLALAEAEKAKKEAELAKREVELAKKEAELAKKEIRKEVVVKNTSSDNSWILYAIFGIFAFIILLIIILVRNMKKQDSKLKEFQGQGDLVNNFYGDSGVSQLFNIDMPDTSMMNGTVVGTVVRIALSGKIEETHVAKIFKKLMDDEKTGILTLSMSGVSPQIVDILFKGGTIRTAFCKTGPFHTKLKNNIIKEVPSLKDKVEIIFNESLNSQDKFCTLLRNENIISSDKLDSLASVQAKEIILSIFLWQKGNYQFKEVIEDDLDFEEESKLQFDVTALVQEGINRYKEWKYISKSISKASNVVIFEQGEKEKLFRSNPNKNLLEVIQLIDEKRTIKDICDMSRFSDFKILKLLSRLKEKGYIQFTD